MEPSSQIEILEAQIRECYGRVVWTHKTQEKCADILNNKNGNVKTLLIVLSALTTSGIFVTVLGESKVVGIISAIVSMVNLALNTYLKKYDLGSMAQKHAAAAASIWNIREDYLSLLTDLNAGLLSSEEIRVKRDKLQSDLHKLYKGSPRTINKAYSEASNGLKNMEEMTFSDEEIDNLLPTMLRKIYPS